MTHLSLYTPCIFVFSFNTNVSATVATDDIGVARDQYPSEALESQLRVEVSIAVSD